MNHRHSYTDTEFTVMFWSSVHKSDDPDGCWLWTKCITDKGYGQLTRKQTRQAAHRVSWELTYGSIPPDTWVLHRCDTPACVRPEHLFLGTATDNNHDMIQKGRYSRANKARGESNGNARLTIEQVREIRHLYKHGSRDYSLSVLAQRFCVSPATVRQVVTQRTWTHAV